MSHIRIESVRDAVDLQANLATAQRFALDCEAAGFHRYTDRLCLLQVTVQDRTYVIDPLAFDPSDVLREALEDPEVQVIMHGADFDLRLLKRDLGIRLRGLLDTQIAAALLGEDGLGLASLLEPRLGVTLSKKYQRADWAERPLTEGMLEYAASDTRHLQKLSDILVAELSGVGRTLWAEEEWLALEQVADRPAEPTETEDSVVRVKGARDLSARQVTALRRALEWRDDIARERDRAPFRVIGNPPLIEAVARGARRAEDLTDIKGFPRGLARDEGHELLRQLRSVTEMAEEELEPFPRRPRRGPGRPPPELEELVDRLKAERNRMAEEIGLPRGTLVSNAVILGIARAAPSDLEGLMAVEGMRRWKAEVVGKELLEVLRRSA